MRSFMLRAGLLLLLLLLPALALAQAAPTKMGGVTPTGTVQPMPVRDADTGVGTDWLPAVLPMLAGAGGAAALDAGSGAMGAGTQRVTLATNDIAAGRLLDISIAYGPWPAGGVPTAAVLAAGTDGLGTDIYPLLTDNTGSLLLSQLPAALGAAAPAGSLSVVQDTTGGWTVDADLELAGTAVVGNAADVAAGSLNVVHAGRGTGAADHVDVNAAEVLVLAAAAGRTYARVQVYADTDGSVCCVPGATTNACVDGEILDPSPAADRGGGSADYLHYSGAITCRATGAWTTTVSVVSW